MLVGDRAKREYGHIKPNSQIGKRGIHAYGFGKHLRTNGEYGSVDEFREKARKANVCVQILGYYSHYSRLDCAETVIVYRAIEKTYFYKDQGEENGKYLQTRIDDYTLKVR